MGTIKGEGRWIQLNDDGFKHALPVTSMGSGMGYEVAQDVFCLTIQIVNVCFYGEKGGDWVLIDAGMPQSAAKIIDEAVDRFGKEPQAIILTHGHFDHVGAVTDLLSKWDVPVYAHELELPFLTGQKDYPKGDPAVDGGLVSELSPLFPHHGIDLGDNIFPLPADGTVPYMQQWRWLHTPGHTPGHMSLFRGKDQLLIAGDAFVTVKQESLYRVFTQQQEISGPPKYFTTDWKAAKSSVETLEALQPQTVITGHGVPLEGEELTKQLAQLVEHFEEIAVPDHGRFV